MFKRATRLAALVAAIAAAGCSGSDGAQGPQGAAGTNGNNGTNGTNGVNGVTGKLKLEIDSVVTANGTSTLTFTIRPAAAVCPGGTCDANLASLGQKTFYAQKYNVANNTFDTGAANTFSFGGFQFRGFTADGNGAQYTATKASAGFAPETVTAPASAFIYGYIATKGAVPAPSTGHYMLPSSVSSASKVYGAAPAYTSTANVTGCEKCHGAPYSKHGYRQATVAGLNDFVSCKVCHTDQRPGSDHEWYLIADDPASLVDGVTTTERAKYAYVANVMNDTHNSHAFEFAYPQSMANCVTCHQGKLNLILTDANFKPMVCKSCHPAVGVAVMEKGRAPAMRTLWQKAGATAVHATFDPMYPVTADDACNTCHKNGGNAPAFAALHKGFNDQIYADAAAANAGTKFSATYVSTVVSASYDAASFIATVTVRVNGVTGTTVVAPTVVASLYGFDSKDFLISGHSSQFGDKTPNLEWAEGAVVRGTATPANTNRLTVTPATKAAGVSQWTMRIDLSTWSSMITSGQVKRVELGFLPTIGLDPTGAVSTTNPPVVVTGVTQTIDVTSTKADARIAAASSYGKAIVDPKKCAACHDALGTTFHNPNYGSAGTVGCRLCHFVGSGGSHIEMQSRSIDSYVHALHQMQYMDINTVDPQNAVSLLRYNDHVEANYPNFAGPLNCESCHNANTYDIPDQSRSLPSVLSKSASFDQNRDRGIGSFASQITGPAARACGACHRAQAINEDNGAKLAAFVAHTNEFSSSVADPTALVSTAAYIEYLVGAGDAAPSWAGAKVEQCAICHPRSGSEHQQLFNVWKNGL